jgi:hypothetical protein
MTDEFEVDFSQFLADPNKLTDPQLLVFYGPYGSGKTWLAASAALVEGLYPVLIIDTEGSTTGVVGQFPEGRVDVIRPKEMWPGEEYKKTKALINNLLHKKHKYKTVVIDPMNSVFEWALAVGEKPGDGYAKWNFVREELTDDKALIDQLKNAPFLAILVTHEEKTGGEGEGLTFADFRWQGGGKARVGQYPDMVGYITRDTNSAGVSTSTLHTAPTKRNNAKNRFGLPAKMVDPSMATIMKHIREKKENK